jgi:hypothetical protein
MKSRDLFGYMEKGKFRIGWKHHYMTKLERERYFGRQRLQKGRKNA